jgi:ketosteroid isomerase-like protein
LTNEQKLRELFRLFWEEHDWNAARGIFSPDIRWHGLDEVGLSGDRSGIRDVGQFFRDWLEVWDATSNSIDIEQVTPDVFVVHSHFHGRARTTGIEFEREIGQIFEFRDGLIVKETMFRTVDEAREAATGSRSSPADRSGT